MLPTSTQALSCVQESLADKLERADIVAEITAEQLLSSDYSDSLSANFTWEVRLLKHYKGSVSGTFTVEDMVWPGGEATQSRLKANDDYLVFLNDDRQMGLCDYPRSLEMQPLTNEERAVLNGSTEPTSEQCEPYVCRDGTTYAACTEDGTVINYFAPPCTNNGGEVGSEYYPNQPINYTDVNDSTAYVDAIQWATREGLVQGYNDGTFRPTSNINRAEFLKILLDPVGAVCRALYPYPDVDFSAWYGDYIQKASCIGLVRGDPSGTFRPGASINVAEAAKIIVKHHSNGTVEQSSTTDWYTPFVSYLQVRDALPISIKYADQLITRAEMVEMMYRLDLYDRGLAQSSSSSSGPIQELVMQINELQGSLVHPASWGTNTKRQINDRKVIYEFKAHGTNPRITLHEVADGTKEICSNSSCSTINIEDSAFDVAANPDLYIAGIPAQVTDTYNVTEGDLHREYLFYYNDYEFMLDYNFGFPQTFIDEYYNETGSMWGVYKRVMGNESLADPINRLIALHPNKTFGLQAEIDVLTTVMSSLVLR